METVSENHSGPKPEVLTSTVDEPERQSAQNSSTIESSDQAGVKTAADTTDSVIKVEIQQTVTPLNTGKVLNGKDESNSNQPVEVKVVDQEIQVTVELAPQIEKTTGEEAKKAEDAAKARKAIVNHVKAIMGMHYLKSDGTPAEILPGFYLGSIGAALNKKGLTDLEIGHVLCCCDGTKQAFPDLVKYKMLKLLDKPDEDITRYFEETAEYIHEILSKGEKVLVHCFAGKSRSTTIMISYLVKYHNMTVDEALKLIRTKRPVAGPNIGFLQQLRKYEKTFKKAINEELEKLSE